MLRKFVLQVLLKLCSNPCRSQHDMQDREALTPVSALAAILPGSAGERGCAEPTPLALQLTPEAASSCDSPVLAAGRPAAGGYEECLNMDGHLILFKCK